MGTENVSGDKVGSYGISICSTQLCLFVKT